ncbi:MAG: hypothetical protein QOI82_1682 [Actinomycetota bacterium]|jgi:hypothetical protein|nr:hypothetical protein [Actinomycetota bacterium]
MISKKKIAASLAAVASVCLLGGSTLGAGPASAAQAVACTVDGAVAISPGVAAQGTGPNHFSFTQASLSCTGAPGSTLAGNYTNVAASGNTKGIATAFEDCAQGQSDGAASISADGPNGHATGTFSFTRTGTVVKVDGTLSDGTNNATFHATLQFTPDQVCGVAPVTSASIRGGAVIQS